LGLIRTAGASLNPTTDCHVSHSKHQEDDAEGIEAGYKNEQGDKNE
jgi:hypothetical protein